MYYKISLYESFPNYAKEVREAVFINEQGFQNEFDEIDDSATHLVLLNEEDKPIATCRVFWNTVMNAYTLGRLAVIKEYRSKNLGSVMVKEAERYIQQKGGTDIILHAQCRATDFYKKLGFTEFGDIENDEGIPHVWMKKSWSIKSSFNKL
ncbi:MAG: GNAT family N-acetyltransferase [Lachnospiraceae bacterium]|nr:GNAT family N-acetyltransferase [Lachnospiraceae bacterium]